MTNAIQKPAPINLLQHAITVGMTAEFVKRFNLTQAEIQSFADDLNAMVDSIPTYIDSALQDYPGLYLGTHTTPPTTSGTGGPLQSGMVYHHDPDNGDPLEIRLYSPSGWVSTSMSPASILAALLTVDGQDSGLNADQLRGLIPTTARTASAGLLKVGDFGIGGTAPTLAVWGFGTDFNAIHARTALITLDDAMTHGPQGDAAHTYTGTLSVLRREGDGPIMQVLYLAETAWTRTGIKTGASVAWAPWHEMLTSKNVTSYTSGIVQPVVDLGAVGGLPSDETVVCDLSQARVFKADLSAALSTGTVTFDFENLPDTTDGVFQFDLLLRRGGRKAVAFNCNGKVVRWSGNTAPALATSSLDADILSFHVMDDGGLRIAHTWSGRHD